MISWSEPVSFKSYFRWLYIASPSLSAKNIIYLISILTIWWFPCVESSLVGRGCLLWPVLSLHKTLLDLVLLSFVLQGQTCLLFQVSLDFLLLHSNPLCWKGHLFFWLLVLEGLIGLHRPKQLQFLLHQLLGHRPRWLWHWMLFIVNDPRLFYGFWDCTLVLHFRLICWFPHKVAT